MIHQLKDRVKALLTMFPTYRETDRKLVAHIWKDELEKQGYYLDKMTAMELLTHYSQGNLTNEESIGRCRRKLQEKNPELRGHNYLERQKKQSDVKDEIKNKKWS